MKITIPVEGNRETVCASFGRAPYYLIHDSESNTDDFKANPAANAEGGAGIKAAQFVLDTGADVLITMRCGQKAADVFKAAGIKIYKTTSANAQENLKALSEGKLEELSSFHAGFHGRA